jgi:CheY-like chemotaxis protein
LVRELAGLCHLNLDASNRDSLIREFFSSEPHEGAVVLFASKHFMARPTILIAEPEPDQALSVRKLVLETAKFNVLTAHSTREALDIFHLFPNIDMAVLVMSDVIDCGLISRSIKQVTKKIQVVGLSPRIGDKCENADHMLSSHEPEQLVTLIRSVVGDPR